MSRGVLIVSPHFPPTNAPDLQRVRLSLPHYATYGWRPVVLAVSAVTAGAPVDSRLSETVPSGIPVHRVHAMSERWTRQIGVGNVAYRAWFRLRAEGTRLLKNGDISLVYFSTTQFIATLLGREWLKNFGVPFVVDIQDPWQTDYYDRAGAPQPPGGWKYRLAKFQAARLESRAWQSAAGFVSVSPAYLETLRRRYPWFSAKPSVVVPFGASVADFEVAAKEPETSVAFFRQPGRVHFVSVGAVGPIMRPAAEALFAGLANLRQRNPAAADRVRMHFFGTSYAPADRAHCSVRPVADAFGVADLVEECPQRVGYFSSLKTMLAADALIVLGSNESGYSPSKLGNVALSGQPTLAIVPDGSAAARRVDDLGFAQRVAPEHPAATENIAQLLEQDGWRRARRAIATNKALASCTAEFAAQQECALFDQVMVAER